MPLSLLHALSSGAFLIVGLFVTDIIFSDARARAITARIGRGGRS